MKVKNVNAYEKNGKKVVVIQLENKEVIFVNYGLLKYALENIKKGKVE